MSKDGNEGRVVPGPEVQGDLSALLVAEQKLSELLEQATARAREMIEQASLHAATAKERLAIDLEQEVEHLRTRLIRERGEEVAAVGARLRAESQRYLAVDERGVATLATSVVDALLLPPESGPVA